LRLVRTFSVCFSPLRFSLSSCKRALDQFKKGVVNRFSFPQGYSTQIYQGFQSPSLSESPSLAPALFCSLLEGEIRQISPSLSPAVLLDRSSSPSVFQCVTCLRSGLSGFSCLHFLLPYDNVSPSNLNAMEVSFSGTRDAVSARPTYLRQSHVVFPFPTELPSYPFRCSSPTTTGQTVGSITLSRLSFLADLVQVGVGTLMCTSSFYQPPRDPPPPWRSFPSFSLR